MADSNIILHLQASAATSDVNTLEAYFKAWDVKSPMDRPLLDTFSIVLFEAVMHDSVETVIYLLDVGLPMNAEIFSIATQNSFYGVLQAFLDHGWDINTPTNFLTPPALWFLDHGAEPNARCGRDCTPLSWAVREANLSVIETFLKYGGDVQCGQLLHYAAMRELPDRLEVLRLLLAKGLPINNIMYQNRLDDYYFSMYSGIGTTLNFAAGKGLLDSAKLLLENGANPLVKDPAGKLAIAWAEYHGHKDVANFLRPLSVPSREPQFSFTDQPGHHFTPAQLVDFQNGWRIVLVLLVEVKIGAFSYSLINILQGLGNQFHVKPT